MLNLVTVATFVLVVSVTWLAVRMLLKPRPTIVGVPALEGVSARQAMASSDQEGGAFAESLAAQFPETVFAGEEELNKDFRRAGYYGPNARQRFFVFRNGLTILAVFATGGAAVAIGPGHQRTVAWTLALGLVAAVMCFSVPRIILALNARQRVERISAALPNALDTISMCLHGGISLQECLGFVGQEMVSVHPDLSLELLMVGRQADINSFEFAIQQFAARIDAPEIVALASLVTQNQRLGTGIVESIQDFADSLRLKRRQIAEAKAGRAELFLLFPVVFFLVPSILILLWGPPILTLMDFLRGPGSPLRIGQ
jgi:tight adherence protein C